MEEKRFSKVILMGRAGVQALSETLFAVKDYLQSLNVTVGLEANTAKLMGASDLPIITSDSPPSDYELVIVVGGDGSLINASHFAVRHNLPVLGINRGQLGFLTDIRPDQLTQIDAILSGHYVKEKRFFLQVALSNGDNVEHESLALNDIVISRGDLEHMIEFDTIINNQFVCSQRADGLIISSPTGSTAYSLSGGGPILHPQLEAIVLLPMFAHTLSTRPIVVDSHSTIEIMMCQNKKQMAYLSADGQVKHTMTSGHRITIKRTESLLHLIHPADYNYFSTLREKLGWERQTHRSYQC